MPGKPSKLTVPPYSSLLRGRQACEHRKVQISCNQETWVTLFMPVHPKCQGMPSFNTSCSQNYYKECAENFFLLYSKPLLVLPDLPNH